MNKSLRIAVAGILISSGAVAAAEAEAFAMQLVAHHDLGGNGDGRGKPHAPTSLDEPGRNCRKEAGYWAATGIMRNGRAHRCRPKK